MDRKKLMRFYVVLMLVAIGVGGWYTKYFPIHK